MTPLRPAVRPRPAAALPPLSPDDALRLQRHCERLRLALQARDRGALRQAKQAVLRAAYLREEPATPALRQALRRLTWWMAAMRLPR